MPWKSQGEKRKCEGGKGTGSREREKEKDGNGENERIYPLENICDYLSIYSFLKKLLLGNPLGSI